VNADRLVAISPWTSKPLTEASKDAHARALLSLTAERVLLGRSAIITGWVIGGVGVASLTASCIVVSTLFPLKQTEIKFFVADQSTGIISAPVSIEDAPKVFSQAQDWQYLRRYIEARETWVWEMDQRNDHLAKIMSTADEQKRISESRNSPHHPAKAVGKDGHVTVEHFRFHRQPDGKAGTRSYLVQFDRTVWRGQNQEPVTPYTAGVDFQWRPGLPMTPEDRSDNPGGFQVIDYSSNSDSPDQRRQ
jgi:type IV secretory pathway component VirB8